jgi:hypothetical protein
MRDTITCPVCGGTMGPHWQVFTHVTCQPAPLPDREAEVRRAEWQAQKALNHHHQKLERTPWTPPLKKRLEVMLRGDRSHR